MSFKAAFEQAEFETMRFLEGRGFRCASREVTDDGTLGTFGRSEYRADSQADAPQGWGVILSISPYRLEISLEISDDRGNRYTIWELAQLVGGVALPERSHDLYMAATDATFLRNEFERLTTALRQAGIRFFNGDSALWTDLASQRSLRIQMENDVRAVAKSEVAFQRKDWAAIVQILEPIADRLHGAAAARLNYAKKKQTSAT